MKTNHRKWSAASLFLLTAVTSLMARAGGGGGFGSIGGGGAFSGGGSGGGTFEIFLFILAIPFIILAIVASIIMAIKQHNDMYNSLKDAEQELEMDGLPDFLASHPEFNPRKFKWSVLRIFKSVQKGWSSQDLGKVRRYLSDGVWQRFHTQFEMMGHLQQENKISQLFIYKTALVDIEEEGAFDTIHVGIMASCKDIFFTGADDTGRGGREKFIEYWSFTRRKECSTAFRFDRKCPSCDAVLPRELGEHAICEHCKSLLNNGEHDWVLSEITQASEWENRRDNSAVLEQCEALTQDVPDFSRQLIEDKASNAFMQILGAITAKDPARIRYFLTDELYDHICYSQMDDQPNLYFNHLYLKDASVTGVERTNEFDIVTIALKASFQRVHFTGLGLQSVDGRATTMIQGIEMRRNRGIKSSKYSLYAKCCPVCGAPFKSAESENCEYCGSRYNSPAAEWIVSDLISSDGKRKLVTDRAGQTAFSLKESTLEEMDQVKSIVMNNLLVLAYADRDFSQREKRFIDEVARKLNFSRAKLDMLRGDAARGALSLRIPETKSDKRTVLTMMKKLAFADEELSPEEIAVMKEFEEATLTSEVQEFEISF